MEYLKKILAHKITEISDINQKLKDDCFISGKSYPDKKKSLINNIRKNKINEIKKASPSKGIINARVDAAGVARTYSKYPQLVRGISVVTEPLYFKGEIEYLDMVKAVTDLPVLRKDFIFHEAQIYESLYYGADCILLIASLMGYKKLKKLYELACSLGIECLVEVHSHRDLDNALGVGATFIGVNNRNLKDMSVDSDNILKIYEYASDKNVENIIFVCESGINDTKIEYLEHLYDLGVSTFLIGTYFMQSTNLDITLGNLSGRFSLKGLV
jgi:indole-3-glycerol phosphate synthase